MNSGQRVWKNNRQRNRYVPDFMNNPIYTSSAPMEFYTNTVLTDIGICVGMSNVNLNCENRRCYPTNIGSVSTVTTHPIDYFNTLISKPTPNNRLNLHLHNSTPQSPVARCCNFDIFNKTSTYHHDDSSVGPIISTLSPSTSVDLDESMLPLENAKKLYPIQQSLPSSDVDSNLEHHTDWLKPPLPPSFLTNSGVTLINSSDSFDYVKDAKLQYYKQYEMSKPLGHNNSRANSRKLFSSSDDLAKIKAPKKKWIRHYFEGIFFSVLLINYYH